MGDISNNYCLTMLDTLVKICGLIYLTKLLLSWFIQLFKGINTYILPCLIDRQGDFRSLYGEWALVTGCTGGIGREYALQLARKGMNMVLVSRSKDKLDSLAKHIESEVGVKTQTVVADMRRPEVLPEIVSRVEGLDVGVLVNNVGVAGGDHVMPFLDQKRNDVVDMINVNCTVATYLCHALLPSMKKNGRGAII